LRCGAEQEEDTIMVTCRLCGDEFCRGCIEPDTEMETEKGLTGECLDCHEVGLYDVGDQE
jgi:hypothetical protein